ncbi:LOW QUALITY PROTEIN: hypothetical protein PHMEG_00034633 [Phytophthora megakarya]|uniref:Uncharacterized protein n=1 Tax=Phytophthora megakarya TaxID=4795 RepID=A0A225UQK2_9STRA|nr:LOW QUALITY PROTEIN: hypothetical protein PHMEG_00034633 [Phytophthora megakarya]
MGPVKTYRFREYPSTLEAAITLAMQEKFSLRQAKLYVNVPLPPEPAAEVADEVQNQWTFQVQLLRDSWGREPTCDASGAETSDIMHASVRHQYTRSKVDVAIQGIVTVVKCDRNLARRATAAARSRERDGPGDRNPTLGRDIKTISQDLTCDNTGE